MTNENEKMNSEKIVKVSKEEPDEFWKKHTFTHKMLHYLKGDYI